MFIDSGRYSKSMASTKDQSPGQQVDGDAKVLKLQISKYTVQLSIFPKSSFYRRYFEFLRPEFFMKEYQMAKFFDRQQNSSRNKEFGLRIFLFWQIGYCSHTSENSQSLQQLQQVNI